MDVSKSRPVEVSAPSEIASAPASFADGVSAVLGELQRACAAVLESLPDPVHRAVDLERGLKLDKKLAWQVFKIARSAHPPAEGLNVPARASVRRLAAAARKGGVPGEVVEQVVEAFESFERFVADHAGDRETFGSLMGSIVHDVGHEVTDRHRVAMFRANAHLWGLRADAVVRCVILHPSKRVPDGLDVATIYGFINLHRLRHGAPVVVTVGAGERGHADMPATEPDRKRSPRELPMVLEAFSSGPLGPVEWSPHPHLTGRAQFELAGLGRGASITFYTVQVRRATADSPRPELDNSSGISTPMAMIQNDLLMPVGVSNPATAKVTVYGSRSEFPTPMWEVRPGFVLPHREHAVTFRCGGAAGKANVPPSPEMPRYEEAVSHVMASLEWDSTEFDVYRCRVAYPFFHTIVRLNVDRAES